MIPVRLKMRNFMCYRENVPALDFAGIPRLLGSAIERHGLRTGAHPDVDDLVALDAEIRAMYSAGSIA